MGSLSLLQLAAEFRARAAAANFAEQADLLFLADEYEAAARDDRGDKQAPFSVKLPK